MSTCKELHASCDGIAEEIELIAEGKVLYCPYCRGYEARADTWGSEEKNEVDDIECPECKQGVLEEKPMSAYLDDVLDLRFTISAKGEYLHGSICVGFGGPNIWINTENGDEQGVHGYWGGDHTWATLSRDAIDQLDDALEELYNCVKG